MSQGLVSRAMFTGLVQALGSVQAIESNRTGSRYVICTQLDLDNVPIGASICCSGCCLTVVEKDQNRFSVDVSNVTLFATTIHSWELGRLINLEKSLKVGDELGGHIVSGHVDTVCRVRDIIPDGASHRMVFEIPLGFAKFIAPKGSVCLDGVSLTVNTVDSSFFCVNIIPHTWDVTTLGLKKVDDQVNLEIDMLARYVARILETSNS